MFKWLKELFGKKEYFTIEDINKIREKAFNEHMNELCKDLIQNPVVQLPQWPAEQKKKKKPAPKKKAVKKKIKAKVAAKKNQYGKWIKNTGVMPSLYKGQVIQFLIREGEINIAPHDRLRWDIRHWGSDIIKYRVKQTKKRVKK